MDRIASSEREKARIRMHIGQARTMGTTPFLTPNTNRLYHHAFKEGHCSQTRAHQHPKQKFANSAPQGQHLGGKQFPT